MPHSPVDKLLDRLKESPELMSRQEVILTEAVTRDLIEQTAQGNQRAFEELCRAYEKPFFRMALNILGNSDIADEVMQDVLLAIWEGSRNFKGDSKPFSWMWAIVRHKAIGALRTRLRSARFAEKGTRGRRFQGKAGA